MQLEEIEAWRGGAPQRDGGPTPTDLDEVHTSRLAHDDDPRASKPASTMRDQNDGSPVPDLTFSDGTCDEEDVVTPPADSNHSRRRWTEDDIQQLGELGFWPFSPSPASSVDNREAEEWPPELDVLGDFEGRDDSWPRSSRSVSPSRTGIGAPPSSPRSMSPVMGYMPAPRTSLFTNFAQGLDDDSDASSVDGYLTTDQGRGQMVDKLSGNSSHSHSQETVILRSVGSAEGAHEVDDGEPRIDADDGETMTTDLQPVSHTGPRTVTPRRARGSPALIGPNVQDANEVEDSRPVGRPSHGTWMSMYSQSQNLGRSPGFQGQ